MPTLQDILGAADVRPLVVERCTRLIDAEVARKSGLAGVAIKTAYKLVQKIKPSMVGEVTEKLLPEFARAIDPLFQESLAEAQSSEAEVAEVFRSKLEREAERAADALLGVTDAKIVGARPTIQKAYGRLRAGAKAHVKQAVPGLGRAISEFL